MLYHSHVVLFVRLLISLLLNPNPLLIMFKHTTIKIQHNTTVFIHLARLTNSNFRSTIASLGPALWPVISSTVPSSSVRGVPAVTAAAAVNCVIAPSMFKVIIINNPITICMIKERLSIAMPTIAIKLPPAYPSIKCFNSVTFARNNATSRSPWLAAFLAA